LTELALFHICQKICLNSGKFNTLVVVLLLVGKQYVLCIVMCSCISHNYVFDVSTFSLCLFLRWLESMPLKSCLSYMW